MNTTLKACIESAIQAALDDNCEDGLWDGWIHPELVAQMTNAAEQVFDAAMKAQEFEEAQR